ncbi:MAG: hypothetical protein ABL930_05830 [Pseudobdellovibrio sp.]
MTKLIFLLITTFSLVSLAEEKIPTDKEKFVQKFTKNMATVENCVDGHVS